MAARRPAGRWTRNPPRDSGVYYRSVDVSAPGEVRMVEMHLIVVRLDQLYVIENMHTKHRKPLAEWLEEWGGKVVWWRFDRALPPDWQVLGGVA